MPVQSSKKLIAICIVLGHQSCVSSTVSLADPLATTSLELKSQFARSLRNIKMMYIDSQIESLDEGKSPDSSIFLRNQLAFRLPDTIVLISHHGSATRSWRSDPLRTKTILSGLDYRVEWPFERLIEYRRLKKGEPAPDRIRFDEVLMSLGLWPIPSVFEGPRINGVPVSLMEVARSSDYQYSGVEALDYADGIRCLILELPGADQLWLDMQNPMIVHRRITYGSENQGAVQEIRYIDHTEVSEGVFIPGIIEHRVYQHKEGELLEFGRMIKGVRILVCDVKLNNDVDQSIFLPTTPPGAAVMDRYTGEFEQVRPGGIDLLDVGVAIVVNRKPNTAETPQQYDSLITGTLIAALVLILCYTVIRIAIPRFYRQRAP